MNNQNNFKCPSCGNEIDLTSITANIRNDIQREAELGFQKELKLRDEEFKNQITLKEKEFKNQISLREKEFEKNKLEWEIAQKVKIENAIRGEIEKNHEVQLKEKNDIISKLKFSELESNEKIKSIEKQYKLKLITINEEQKAWEISERLKIKNEFDSKVNESISKKEKEIQDLKLTNESNMIENLKLENSLKEEKLRSKDIEEQVTRKITREQQEKIEERLETERKNQKEEVEKLKQTHEIENNRFQSEIEKLHRKIQRNELNQEIQGEQLEEFVKQRLMEWYPSDIIDDVKKGTKGADLIQIINAKINLGSKSSIIYEIKNTKEWSEKWLEKMQSDLILHEGYIGIIITNTLPREMRDSEEVVRWYEKANVVICKAKLETIRSVTLLAREIINQIEKSNSNKDVNARDRIYEVIQSPQFQNRLNLVMNQFEDFKKDLDDMKKKWDKYYNSQIKRITSSDEYITEIRDIIEVVLQGNKYLIDSNNKE